MAPVWRAGGEQPDRPAPVAGIAIRDEQTVPKPPRNFDVHSLPRRAGPVGRGSRATHPSRSVRGRVGVAELRQMAGHPGAVAGHSDRAR